MKDHYPYASVKQLKEWEKHHIVQKYPDLLDKVIESLLVKKATRKK